jgi:glucose-6-phosphate isomerase
MLNIDISDLNVKGFDSLKSKLVSFRNLELPAFDSYREDIDSITPIVRKYRKYDNLIVIGNGGSNTSFRAYHRALVPLSHKKRMAIMTTMEPDLINELKEVFPRRKTLIMPVSKSGTTIGLLEAMFAFPGYRLLPVTSPEEGALSVIAKKEDFDIIPHPAVGGRFSGLTAPAFAPALFFDIDVKSIDNGARAMYLRCSPKIPIEQNPALKLAAALYLLDKKGYDEIFCPIYSSKLVGFDNLIVQLLHESVCKKEKGQTIYCADAPESQHHTNQRFFGGKKNVLGLFVTVDSQKDTKSTVKVPDSVKDIKLREGELGDINGLPYYKSLEYEWRGTYEDATSKKIPCARVSLDVVSAFTVGEFIGFWHYVAVYSSWLRGVNAFDQPQVESSKELSFKLRKEHRK